MKKTYTKPVLLIEEMVSDTSLSSGYTCQFRGGTFSSQSIPLYNNWLEIDPILLNDKACWKYTVMDIENMCVEENNCYCLDLAWEGSDTYIPDVNIGWDCGEDGVAISGYSLFCREGS